MWWVIAWSHKWASIFYIILIRIIFNSDFIVNVLREEVVWRGSCTFSGTSWSPVLLTVEVLISLVNSLYLSLCRNGLNWALENGVENAHAEYVIVECFIILERFSIRWARYAFFYYHRRVLITCTISWTAVWLIFLLAIRGSKALAIEGWSLSETTLHGMSDGIRNGLLLKWNFEQILFTCSPAWESLSLFVRLA